MKIKPNYITRKWWIVFILITVLGQTYRPFHGRNSVHGMSNQTSSAHRHFRMANGGIVLARHSDDYNVAHGLLPSPHSQQLPIDFKASFPR